MTQSIFSILWAEERVFNKKYRFNTLLVQSYHKPLEATKTITPAIYHTAAYYYDKAEDISDVFAGRKVGYVYTRISNPTTESVERKLANLEGGQGAILCASGMAAISLACLSILRAGDEIISATGIFGGTLSFFKNSLKQFNVNTVFVDVSDARNIESAITNRTRLIFIETIGNPLLNVPDIKQISQVAKKHGIPLFVDNTLGTPYLIKLKEFGANIIIYSTTKFITGSGSTIGGAVIDCGNFAWGSGRFLDFAEHQKQFGDFAFLAKARRILRDFGYCIAPFNAYMTAIGLETLSLRMDRQCENAMKLAKALSTHPKVLSVNYPGLIYNPYHNIAKKQFKNRYGAILTLTLKDKQQAFNFIDKLKLAKNTTNIGDSRTLVIHPASTIFLEFSEAERLKNGVKDGLVRVSVGIEDAHDIINDFKQALEAI